MFQPSGPVLTLAVRWRWAGQPTEGARMPRLHGGPADGCEVPATRSVISVRVQDGEPVYGPDGQLLTSCIQPSSARGQWEPYTFNRSAGAYWYARFEPDRRPPWYDALPNA